MEKNRIRKHVQLELSVLKALTRLSMKQARFRSDDRISAYERPSDVEPLEALLKLQKNNANNKKKKTDVNTNTR